MLHREGGDRLDQRGFWALVRRRWVVVIAWGLLGVIAGSAFVLITPPEYSAGTEVFVATVGGDDSSELAQGSNFSQQQARNYSVVARREIVLDPVISALGLNTTSRELSRRVSASVPLNTSLISISVTDSTPERAAATANAVATSLANTVIRLVPRRSDGSSPVHLQVVQNAAVPTAPASPNAPLVLAFAALGGLFAGVALIVVRELVSARVRSVDHIREIAGLPILGSVDYDRDALTTPLSSQTDGLSLRGEEFRHIRTNLHHLHPDDRHKVFVLTSSIPGEGKSTAAANLAVTLAAAGSTTCLVEADLRKPSLGRYFDLEGSLGLTTVLAGDATMEDALQSWGPHDLRVLLSGAVPPNPSELLESKQAQQLLTTLKERFDVVIIDCPPLMPVTDAAIVARAFGGAILVVGIERVEIRELRSAIDALAASGAPILGAIANFAPVSGRSRYQRGFAHTEANESDRKRRGKTQAQRMGTASVAD